MYLTAIITHALSYAVVCHHTSYEVLVRVIDIFYCIISYILLVLYVQYERVGCVVLSVYAMDYYAICAPGIYASKCYAAWNGRLAC